MNLRHQCSRQAIEDFLAKRLKVDDQSSLEAHLSECESCRTMLANATVDEKYWKKAAVYLQDDDHELLPLSTHQFDDSKAESSTLMVRQVLNLLAPTDDPNMLGRFGEYEVSGVVGCGGMGAVLKGFDRSLNRVVAIKVMAPHLASSAAARKRFAREAQAAAAMTHDNVVDIYGVSEANGLPYLVMPYARGPSLQKRIDQEGALTVVEILRIGHQVAAGLAAAHEQGLVHRDIKPANIILQNDGIERLVITDFGLARAVDDASVTRTGVIAGTPQFMSPEQARGEAVDHRSDLFSLGSVLYATCTGRPPFRADSTFGILRRITDNKPTPIREINPEIPAWLCKVISRLHAKSPDDRFQSAEEVAGLMQQCLAHVQTLHEPLPRELRTEAARKNRLVASVGAIAVCGAIAFVVLGFPSRLSTPSADEQKKGADQDARYDELPSPPMDGFGKPSYGHTIVDEAHWSSVSEDIARIVESSASLADESQYPFGPGSFDGELEASSR